MNVTNHVGAEPTPGLWPVTVLHYNILPIQLENPHPINPRPNQWCLFEIISKLIFFSSYLCTTQVSPWAIFFKLNIEFWTRDTAVLFLLVKQVMQTTHVIPGIDSHHMDAAPKTKSQLRQYLDLGPILEMATRVACNDGCSCKALWCESEWQNHKIDWLVASVGGSSCVCIPSLCFIKSPPSIASSCCWTQYSRKWIETHVIRPGEWWVAPGHWRTGAL